MEPFWKPSLDSHPNSASRALVRIFSHHPAHHFVSESAVLAYLNLLHIRRIKRAHHLRRLPLSVTNHPHSTVSLQNAFSWSSEIGSCWGWLQSRRNIGTANPEIHSFFTNARLSSLSRIVSLCMLPSAIYREKTKVRLLRSDCFASLTPLLLCVYIPRGGRFWPEARKRPLDREEAFRQ